MDGWMDSRADPCADQGYFVRGGGPGPTAGIQDPHMEYIHTYVQLTYIHACMHTHTYILMYRKAHECSCTGRRIDIRTYMYRRQTKRQTD